MKPWEYKGTLRTLRKLSGSKTVEIGADLTDCALRILADSIKAENPDLTKAAISEEMRRIIWQLSEQVSKYSLAGWHRLSRR